MSVSPFEHPYLGGLFADAEMASFFSAPADLAAMLRFEIALAEAEATAGVLSASQANAIIKGVGDAVLDHEALREGVATDGVIVPALIRQLRAAVDPGAADKVHFGATSQDVIDTSLMLRLKQASDLVLSRLSSLALSLQGLAVRNGSRSMMAYTRMQPAIPIPVSDRIDSWRRPLERHRDRLQVLVAEGFPVQFGGAAGSLEKLGDKGPAVRADLARRLGLVDRPQWQSQRDPVVELANIIALITGSLGKFGQDIALLAQVGTDIRLTGGGGSSAMPHKQNPVAAETLVTLARFNAVQMSALHQAMVHEQERSGAAWMLEWMVLPHMMMATGVSLMTATRLCHQVQALGH